MCVLQPVFHINKCDSKKGLYINNILARNLDFSFFFRILLLPYSIALHITERLVYTRVSMQQ